MSPQVTYDECVQLTKPGREIFKTLESVSITLNPYLAQSQGNEVYGLEQSTNPNMASEMDESTNLNSRCTSKKVSELSTTVLVARNKIKFYPGTGDCDLCHKRSGET